MVPTPAVAYIGGGGAGLLLSRGGGGGEGGRGFWTQNLVYQKWPDQIFPIVNFVFSHYGHFGLGRGGGGFGGGPPTLVFNYSKEALGGGGFALHAHCVNNSPCSVTKSITWVRLVHCCTRLWGQATCSSGALGMQFGWYPT